MPTGLGQAFCCSFRCLHHQNLFIYSPQDGSENPWRQKRTSFHVCTGVALRWHDARSPSNWDRPINSCHWHTEPINNKETLMQLLAKSPLLSQGMIDDQVRGGNARPTRWTREEYPRTGPTAGPLLVLERNNGIFHASRKVLWFFSLSPFSQNSSSVYSFLFGLLNRWERSTPSVVQLNHKVSFFHHQIKILTY